jgi:hypothetical protein
MLPRQNPASVADATPSESIEMNFDAVSKRRMILAARVMALMICGLFLLALGGCSSSKAAAPVTIAFTQGQVPPSSVMASSSTQFAATVANDTQNLGVSWLLTCGAPVAQCGSVTRHTASGEPATYIAPASAPPGGTVTIQANSSAVPSAGITATITVTPYISGPISVAFNPPLPSTVTIGTLLPVSVIVTNDVIGSNGQPDGAMLSVSCQVAGNCGYFSGSYYIPPSVIPAGNTVTITAASVADPSATANATLTILPPVVTISLVVKPPAPIPAGSATNLAAYVTDGTATNTAGQMGVDWSISCGASACGSLIPLHTASDNGRSSQQLTTSFTAPSIIPPGGTVTVTASATANPTTQVSVTLTITPVSLNNGVLNGQYAFFMSGVDSIGLSALAGGIVADGNGNITAAEESLPGNSTTLTGITGTYYIGSDGRGLMTLDGLPNSSPEWLNGQQTFSLAVVDSAHVFMEEFDGSDPYNIQESPITSPPFGETLRGELDLQQTSDFSSPPSGPYAFALTQAGPVSPYAGYYGGVLNADSSGSITSFAIDRYVDGATTSISSGTYGSQSFGTVDTFGYGTASIGPYSLNYFLVDSSHLIVIGSSSSDGTGLPGGHAYSQPATTNSLAGTYIFILAGSSPLFSESGSSVIGSNPQALGGWVTSDANGNLNGYLDTNNDGKVESAAVTGTLTASAVPGRWLMTLTGGGASSFALYPTSNGLFIFQLDFGKSGTGNVALQSSPAPAISGNYAVSIQQPGGVDGSRSVSLGLFVGDWADISGQVIASNSFDLSGTFDIDQINGVYLAPAGNIWTQTLAQPVTGNFTSGTQGRFTGTITINQTVTTPGPLGTLSEIFYVVDSSHILALEDDSTPAVGVLQLQNF